MGQVLPSRKSTKGQELPSRKSTEEDEMAQAIRESLMDSGGASGNLYTAADDLLRSMGPMRACGGYGCLRKRTIEPSGWCFLEACLRQLQ